MGTPEQPTAGRLLIVKHQATEEAPVGFDEGGTVCCCFHGVNGKMIFTNNKNRDKMERMVKLPDFF